METKEKIINVKIKSAKYDSAELPGSEKMDINRLLLLPPTDLIEDETEGLLRIIGDRLVVMYNETEKSGMVGTRSMLSFLKENPDEIKIMRSGAVRSAFTFKQNVVSKSKYATTFFYFNMNVTTLSVENSIDETGGRLTLDYILEIPYSLKERTLMIIDINEIEDEYPISE